MTDDALRMAIQKPRSSLVYSIATTRLIFCGAIAVGLETFTVVRPHFQLPTPTEFCGSVKL